MAVPNYWGRFYSCPLDDVHLWRALAYIERNPVRALLELAAWRAAWTPARWARQLQEPEDEGWRRRFWRAANTGRTWGDQTRSRRRY